MLLALGFISQNGKIDVEWYLSLLNYQLLIIN